MTYNDHQNIPFHRFCSDISDAVHTVTWDSHAVLRGFNQSQVVSFRTPSATLMFLDSKNSWALARFNQIDLRMKFHHEFQQMFSGFFS